MEEEKPKTAKPEVRVDYNKHGIRRETYINVGKQAPKRKSYRKDKEDK